MSSSNFCTCAASASDVTALSRNVSPAPFELWDYLLFGEVLHHGHEARRAGARATPSISSSVDGITERYDSWLTRTQPRSQIFKVHYTRGREIAWVPSEPVSTRWATLRLPPFNMKLIRYILYIVDVADTLSSSLLSPQVFLVQPTHAKSAPMKCIYYLTDTLSPRFPFVSQCHH